MLLSAIPWGAERLRGNCRPIEPAPDNAGEGNGYCSHLSDTDSSPAQLSEELRLTATPDQRPSTPIALTIAGSDSGGGAGVQADLKAFSALGVYSASVITAITAQNTVAVNAVMNLPEDLIAQQIKTVLDDLVVNAIKIGMLSSSEIIATVVEALKGIEIPVVVDPVMVAKSGDTLLQQSAIDSLRTLLIPRATLLTPNLPEAATILSCETATSVKQMEQQGNALMELGARAVLMKGGHADGAECVDVLLSQDHPTQHLHSQRIDTQNTHGTGCTLSASIYANLAKKMSLPDAVTDAHGYLAEAIRRADELTIGQGHGPVHHFHRQW